MKPTFFPALPVLALASFAVLAHNEHDKSAAGGEGAAIGQLGDRAKVSRTGHFEAGMVGKVAVR